MDDATFIPGARRATAQVGDLRIAFWEAGAGVPLLLLHGIGSAGESFAPQLAGLAGRFRVIAWDAPGYGGSDDHPTSKPLPRDYADVAAGLLDALGVARAHVLGHSLGGLMAGALACRHAGRVDRLILASVAAGYRLGPADPYPPALQGRLDDFAALGAAGVAEKRVARLCAPDARPEAVAAVRRVMAKLRMPGYAQAVALLGQGDLIADAPAIAAPTLVVCGDADVVTPPERCRAVAGAIAGARYRSLGPVGHGCYVEDPAGFNAAVADFLEAAR
ncbi:MAG: alpha/beta fold hydrolase [Alphaproteobacteria bacterium]|nr:alpha/beta fold hydrolase [Alphaproteobacteria bacterium]